MKLLIYEYFSAGGGREDNDLTQAGFAILEALLRDFTRLSGLQVQTVLDTSLKQRVEKTYYENMEINWKESKHSRISASYSPKYEEDQIMEDFIKGLQQCEAVLIVAPENEQLLCRLTKLAEGLGREVLGSSSRALELTSNKALSINYLAGKGLPVPKTEVIRLPIVPGFKESVIERFPLPLVVKPLFGTGGQGVWLIRSPQQLFRLLDRLNSGKTREYEEYLLQEYIPGITVSVSCFVVDGLVLPVSLNRQILEQEDELLFCGVEVPYNHSQAQAVLKIAAQACQAVKGLKGFVGVDLVVNSSGPVIMEINSRPTSAYVALQQVAEGNLAEALWHLNRSRSLPAKVKINGNYTYQV